MVVREKDVERRSRGTIIYRRRYRGRRAHGGTMPPAAERQGFSNYRPFREFERSWKGVVEGLAWR